MLQLTPYEKNISYRRLKHSERVFHDALNGVLKGEVNFQVIDPVGGNYCLHYIANIDWAKKSEMYPKSKHMENYPQYPPYLEYDENDPAKMSFDIFSGMDRVWFKEANEYTITIARVLLKHTDISVIFADERISRFLELSERLMINEEEPDINDTSLLRVVDHFYMAPLFYDNNQVDQIYCFHHVFFFQWLSDLPLKDIRYAQITVPKSEGIGNILSFYAKMKTFFDRYNIVTTIEPGSSRYPDRMLSKYFAMNIAPEDSNENNTVYIINFFASWFARLVGKTCGGEYDITCLDPDFRKQMEEYAEAVMGNKRMLGVLLRGSDFFISDMAALAKPVDAKVAIPYIEKWFREDGYDGIVLATEDADMLEEMKKVFGSKLIAIAQERYRVRQFETAETIAELEHELMDEETYDIHVEDTTVNYFYALYLLSRCDSFIYSNICGGERLTHIFNNGRFRKELCIAQMFLNPDLQKK